MAGAGMPATLVVVNIQKSGSAPLNGTVQHQSGGLAPDGVLTIQNLAPGQSVSGAIRIHDDTEKYPDNFTCALTGFKTATVQKNVHVQDSYALVVIGDGQIAAAAGDNAGVNTAGLNAA